MSEDPIHEEVFVDTCVLLNFVQREWERDHSTLLVEPGTVDLVVSQNVVDELRAVSERRHDIYEDMLDFLLESEKQIEEYDPGDRRVYLGSNDVTHVRNIQMTLSDLDDRREILRRLRRYVRAAGRRVEHLRGMLDETTIDPVSPFGLAFALDTLLSHSADAKIVADAAWWSANGGSGVLVTLDRADLLDRELEIVDLLESEQGSGWVIELITPDEVAAEPKSPTRAE